MVGVPLDKDKQLNVTIATNLDTQQGTATLISPVPTVSIKVTKNQYVEILLGVLIITE